jgi:hypothetical protein
VALLAREGSPGLQLVAVLATTAALCAVAIWVDLRWARVRRGDARG